jgi:glycine/D-amino acid oxidase-like deaminating enzyme
VDIAAAPVISGKGRTVAVIGGGLMGCCAALELAARGARVVLFDAEADLMTRASAGGEAKIHLGYVYANDPTLATARKLMGGALRFEAFLRRHVEDPAILTPSVPFTYAVPRQSMLSPDRIEAYLNEVAVLLRDAGAGRSYFGQSVTRAPRRLAIGELAERLDPETVAAAFETGEVALDPVRIAAALRDRIHQDPKIEVRRETFVASVEQDGRVLRLRDGTQDGGYDAVLNAAWDGRLALDSSQGISPPRPWSFRLKYGMRLAPGAVPEGVGSLTFLLGPFGDVVSYADGSHYLSWYPACMTRVSRQVDPPRWSGRPTAATGRRIREESFAALGALVPGLRGIGAETRSGAVVRGGTIYALGQTDIDDPDSGLHTRHEIGLVSKGAYHSVDTGKYTMAPALAEDCAERILG